MEVASLVFLTGTLRKDNFLSGYSPYCRSHFPNYYYYLTGGPEGKYHLEDLIVDGTIILQTVFKKWDEEAWTGLIWHRIGTGGGRL